MSRSEALDEIKEALNVAAATIERLHRENSALRQELETARQQLLQAAPRVIEGDFR